MRLSGREFSGEDISTIKGMILEHPEMTRRGLSRLVCEEFGWRSVNGKSKELSCRKALLALDRLGMIMLPDAQSGFFQPKSEKADKCEEVTHEIPEVSCELPALGDIRVIPVNGSKSRSSRIWNQLMERFHYLGKGPLCGAQIRYLVESAEYGYVGALSYSGALWRLKARDEYIGWSEGARRRHLNEVVCNSRFLILPTVHVKNLASHVLRLSLERVCKDWQERYGTVQK